MVNKSGFDNPLEGIDPIMEQAFTSIEEDSFKDEPASQPAVEKEPSKNKFSQLADELDLSSSSKSRSDFSSELDSVLDSDDTISNELGRETPQPKERVTQENNLDDMDMDISQVEFPDLAQDRLDGHKIEEGVFSNIPVRVSVELGRANLSLKDVYELTEGSIIELERLVGEPLDLVINDQVIAQGEVVAIDNKYGLRIKNLVSKLSQ